MPLISIEPVALRTLSARMCTVNRAELRIHSCVPRKKEPMSGARSHMVFRTLYFVQPVVTSPRAHKLARMALAKVTKRCPVPAGKEENGGEHN